MVLLKALFVLFILSFPIAEVGRLQFPNGVAIMLNDVLLILTVVTWILLFIKNKRNAFKGNLKKPILIFSAIALLSLLLNSPSLNAQSFIVSFLYLARWVLYACLYFIVFGFDKSFRKKISYIMYLSGFLFVLEGYVQYFLYPNLRNLYYLGWDEHLYRMFSGFLDPNYAGAFFVVYLIFSLYFVWSHFNTKNYLKTAISGIISLMTLSAIYLTYSRSAFLMLLVSTVTFLILINKKKQILIVFVTLILLIFVAPRSFKTTGTDMLRTVSSEARITSMQQAITIFEKSPVIGVGFNAYRYAQNTYLGLDNIYWQTTHSGAGTDDSFLFVLATTGIAGFASFVYLLYKMGKLFIINIGRNKFSVVSLAIILGLAVDSIFINSLFYVFILEWVWILTALSEVSKKEQ